MSNYADANLTSIRFSRESQWGEDPATPTMTEVRTTGGGFNPDKETTVSNEIRSDRQRSDLVEVAAGASGELNFELSCKSFDELLAGLFCNDWLITDATDDLLFPSTTELGFTNPANVDNLRVGQTIRVSDTTDNDGVFKITAINGDTITCDGANFTLSGGTPYVDGRVEGRHLRNGIQHISYLFEQLYDTDTGKSIYFPGQMVSEASLTVEASSIVNGSMSFLGAIGKTSENSIAGSVNPPTTTPVLNATANIGGLKKDGVDMGIAITNIEVSISNNLAQRRAIGSRGAISIRKGTVDVSGSFEAYFAGNQLTQDVINHAITSLSWTFTDSQGNQLIWTIPKIQFDSNATDIEGINTDVMNSIDWTATMDPTTGNTVMLDALYAA